MSVPVPFHTFYEFSSTETNSDSRFSDIEQAIHDHHLIDNKLLQTSDHQHDELIQLKQKVDTLAKHIESEKMRERIDAQGTIEVGGVTCKNAGDILLHGMYIVHKSG